MTAPVRVEVGPVSRIVLSRPDKQNAMTAEMGRLVSEAVQTLNASREPRVVLVVGEGRAFCAGGDFSLIEENSTKTPEQNRREMMGLYSSFLSITRLAVPRAALEEQVAAIVNAITSAAPVAVTQAKETLTAPLLAALDAGLEREAACQALDFATTDLKEAVRAFRESRSPVFRGE